jgi:acetyltransferase-like isoleucine patch superfamily enzyme
MRIFLWLRRICLLPRVAWEWAVDRCYAPCLLRFKGVDCGEGLRLHGVPFISRNRAATIRLGRKVLLNSRPSANVLYLARPCLLAAMAPAARIVIGDGAGLSGATLVAAVEIEIGDRTMIGAEALVVDNDFHPLDPAQRAVHPTAGAAAKPVRIGKDVFIGTRAIILKGVSVGDGAVVGAGAVVAKDVAPGEIVAGNPARVVGSVRQKTQPASP